MLFLIPKVFVEGSMELIRRLYEKNGQFFVTSMIELCPLTLKVDRFKNRHRYCHFQIKQKLIRQRAIESKFFFFSF